MKRDLNVQTIMTPEGILLIDKPIGKTSFSLVGALRRRLNVKTIGHTGTLDPFATGLVVLLVGKKYTRQSDRFLNQDKTYETTVHLGIETDSYDCTGQITSTNSYIPTEEEVKLALESFQGEIEQIPPMFSAKKVNGKKLYELARKGIEIERKAASVKLKTEILSYHYPYLELRIECSKGTYIRSIAHDLGQKLSCGAHLKTLRRLSSGSFFIEHALDGKLLFEERTNESLSPLLFEHLISFV